MLRLVRLMRECCIANWTQLASKSYSTEVKITNMLENDEFELSAGSQRITVPLYVLEASLDREVITLEVLPFV